MGNLFTEAAALITAGCLAVLIWLGVWLTVIGLAAYVVRRVFFGH
jgi:hypothetical protein